MTISLRRLPLLGLTLVFAACGGEGLTLPPDGAAAHIEVLAEGNNQSGRVGETLPLPLVVRVTDTRNRPVADVNVVFTIPDGIFAGEAIPGSRTTGADGLASVALKLGSRAGPVAGMAEVPVPAGTTPVQAPFTATSLPASASGIAMVSGNEQSGTINTALAAPLVVQVTDASGNPIPGISVEWSVAGGGSVSAATTLTGADGQTSVTRTLGGTAGQQTTLATAALLVGSPVTFTHTATAGNAARVIVVDGNGQSAPAGTRLDRDLVVQLLDEQNNPIANRAVSWVVGTGGGSASPETSTTGGNGQATTQWTLGPTPGPNTLTAVVSGVGNGAFNATGTKVASSTTITSHQPDPAIVGTPVTVGVNVTGAGGPPTGQVTVTGETALASCTITLSNGSGNCQITFTQPGNRDITATYAGDAGFFGSADTENHQVSPAPPASTTTTITSDTPEPSDAGAQITVTFTVTSSAGTPTGTVQVTDPIGGSCSASVAAGSCQYTPGGTGLRTITATYQGSAGFSGSSDTEDHTVTPVSTNIPPEADFEPPTCTVGVPCQFADDSRDSDGEVTGWTWDFQDGTPAPGSTLNDRNPVVIFPSPAGPRTVTLIVTDDGDPTGTSAPHPETVPVN